MLFLQNHLYKIIFKEAFALTIKEINVLFNNIRKILAMLDKIYHAVEGNKPEE